MKKKGLYAKCRKRFKSPKPSGIQAVAGHLLNRQFCPIRTDLVWTGDITYIHTTDGWRYLAVWMDLHSRRIIGWALGDTLESSLVIEALDHAMGSRSVILDELMIHTDQGSQYIGKEFQKRLVDKKLHIACLAREIAGIMRLLRVSLQRLRMNSKSLMG